MGICAVVLFSSCRENAPPHAAIPQPTVAPQSQETPENTVAKDPAENGSEENDTSTTNTDPKDTAVAKGDALRVPDRAEAEAKRVTEAMVRGDLRVKPSEEPPILEGNEEGGKNTADGDQTDEMDEEEELPTPLEYLSEKFLPPPNAKRLSQESLLWVDRKSNRVYIDGYVAVNRGPLEMFACPIGTKEHESVVATVAQSSEVHAALLAVGAQVGTPARFAEEFTPPTGQRIRIWVCWLDPDGNFQVIDARKWIQDSKSKESIEADWVFAGSGFFKDEDDGREYYRADGGDMICVSNFSSAMLDLSIPSSADADALLYQPFTERMPERGTPVRLVLVPIPYMTDKPQAPLAKVQDPNEPPSKEAFVSKKSETKVNE